MVAPGSMNNHTLGALLSQRLPGLTGDPDHPGSWRGAVEDMMLYVITDEMHDRMRIMIPVAPIESDDHRMLWSLLNANFDRALDAKYAIHDDMVWSTFLHRLSWLTVAALDDALSQVIMLARNTGTTYASSELFFGGG